MDLIPSASLKPGRREGGKEGGRDEFTRSVMPPSCDELPYTYTQAKAHTYLPPLLILQIRRAPIAVQHVVVGVDVQSLRVKGDGFLVPRGWEGGREGGREGEGVG